MKRAQGIRFAENFLWAGSSALLISIVYLYPQYWFIALFALIPFLYRVGQEPRDAVTNDANRPLRGGGLSPAGRSSNAAGGHKARRYAKMEKARSFAFNKDDTQNQLMSQPPCAPDNRNVRTTRVLTYSHRSEPRGFRPTNAIILGLMLGTCYAVVAYPAELWLTPRAFLLKFFALNLIFVAFGIAVNHLKQRIGFNAVFIAALWLPLEYALSHYAGLGNLFAIPADKGSLMLRISSLFGVLMISFVVVLVNTLILICFKRVVEALRSKATFPVKVVKQVYPPLKEIFLETPWYYSATPRAPPALTGLA